MTFTKLGKKIMAFLAIITFGLVLVGCFEETPTVTFEQAQANVETVAGRVVVFEAQNNITKDFKVASSYASLPDVKYAWSSSEEDLVSFAKNEAGETTAVVTRPAEDDARIVEGENYVLVTITVTLSQEANDGQVATAQKSFELKVEVLTGGTFFGTVQEVKMNFLNYIADNNITVDNSYKESIYSMTYGRVAYMTSKAMFVTDGDYSITVYGDWSSKCGVGDLVKVQGSVTTYYGQLQFDDYDTSVTLLGADDKVVDLAGNEVRSQSEFVMPTYEDKEIEEYTQSLMNSVSAADYIVDAAAYEPFSGGTFNLYGQLLKEEVCSGDAYALMDPYTGTKVSIYHYSTDTAEQKAALDAKVGQYVKMEVVTNDRYSTNDVYRVLWVGTEIKDADAPTLDPEQIIAQAQAELDSVKFEPKYFNGDSFAYPSVNINYNAKIEWTLEGATLVEGKLVVESDGTATVKAVVTFEGLKAEQTYEFEVATEETYSTVAEFKALEAGTYSSLKGLVAAVYARGFVLYDATGYVLVYKNGAVDVEIGDYVKVRGTQGAYPADSTAYQVGSPSIYALDEAAPAGLELPEYVTWTAKEVDAAWAEVVAGTFNFAGPLVEMTVSVTVSGNYINASIEGSTASLSFSYVLDELKALLTDGSTATVKACPISYSNSSGSPKFFNFIVVEVSNATTPTPTPTPTPEDPEHAGTAEDPYTATDAAIVTGKLEDKVATETEYYVTGTVKSITEISTSYGNGTYTITDGTTDFLIFRGYYLEGVKFTSEDQLQVGDVVVVKGKLVNYGGTLEMNSGNALVSIKKGEEPTPTPTPTPTPSETEHAGTAEDPYTATDAALVTGKLEDKVATTEEYYVTGTVVSVTEISTSYGNGTYTITDGTTNFLIFRGYYLEGVKFTSEDQIQVGDVVVVKGKLINYGGTLEMNQGNVLVSITEGEEPTPTPTPTPTEGTNVATFEFGADDATKTDEGTQDGKEISTYTEDNNGYTLTLEGLSKVYGGSYDAKGNACLKLGTSKAVGTLTFTVADDVDFVIIKVAGYKKNVASIVVNDGEAVNVTTLSQNGEYTEIKVDTTTNKTVTLTTTSNGYRCKITSIAYWKAE